MSKKMPPKMKKALKDMFKEGKLNNVLGSLNDCSYFDNEEYNECFDENGECNEKIVDCLIEIIENTAEEFNTQSYIYNGYNGVYPGFDAKYHTFEPSKETLVVNMKEIASNKSGYDEDLNLSLYVKEDLEKPGLMVLFAEPRNDGTRIFAWLVE